MIKGVKNALAITKENPDIFPILIANARRITSAVINIDEPDKSISKWAGLLNQIDRFDNRFFRLSFVYEL